MVEEADGQEVFAFSFLDGHTEPPEEGEQFGQEVTPQGGDGPPAQAELSAVEASLRPKEEGEPHRKSFTAADGAIAEDRVPVRGLPPGKDAQLFWREGAQGKAFWIGGITRRRRANRDSTLLPRSVLRRFRALDRGGSHRHCSRGGRRGFPRLSRGLRA